MKVEVNPHKPQARSLNQYVSAINSSDYGVRENLALNFSSAASELNGSGQVI